jgi:hypothetical protein
MSIENENQNIQSPEAIIDGTTKLICTNKKCGKLTCDTCINLMYDVMFGEPALHYPLLCGACQQPFAETHLNDVLVKHEHYEQYIACVLPLFWSKDCLQDNEQLAQCMYFIKKNN